MFSREAVAAMLMQFVNVERRMHVDLGREPTAQELAVELGMTPEQVEVLRARARTPAQDLDDALVDALRALKGKQRPAPSLPPLSLSDEHVRRFTDLVRRKLGQ